MRLHDVPIYLPLREFKLLHLLMSRAERLVTRDEISARLWGGDQQRSNTVARIAAADHGQSRGRCTEYPGGPGFGAGLADCARITAVPMTVIRAGCLQVSRQKGSSTHKALSRRELLTGTAVIRAPGPLLCARVAPSGPHGGPEQWSEKRPTFPTDRRRQPEDRPLSVVKPRQVGCGDAGEQPQLRRERNADQAATPTY